MAPRSSRDSLTISKVCARPDSRLTNNQQSGQKGKPLRISFRGGLFFTSAAPVSAFPFQILGNALGDCFAEQACDKREREVDPCGYAGRSGDTIVHDEAHSFAHVHLAVLP